MLRLLPLNSRSSLWNLLCPSTTISTSLTELRSWLQMIPHSALVRHMVTPWQLLGTNHARVTANQPQSLRRSSGVDACQDGDDIVGAMTMSSDALAVTAAGMRLRLPQWRVELGISSFKTSGDKAGPIKADSESQRTQMAMDGATGKTRSLLCKQLLEKANYSKGFKSHFQYRALEPLSI